MTHDPATPNTSPEKQPPSTDPTRAEKRHRKPKHARSPRATAASPVPMSASPGPSAAPEVPQQQAVVKAEPGGAEAEAASGGLRFTTANFTEAVVTPTGAVFGGEGGQQPVPDSASAEDKVRGDMGCRVVVWGYVELLMPAALSFFIRGGVCRWK